MPLPKPKKNESHDDFMQRCMSDEVMISEYDDEKQRYAVCQSQWDNSRTESNYYKTFKPDEKRLDDIVSAYQKTNIERRIMPFEDIELRITDDEKPKIVGYAAKFNKWSVDLGGFKERIKTGAFDEALENSDVRALKNHDPNLILGRTSSGTLKLFTNSVGLRSEIDPPDTSTGRDTVEEIRRKDITGMSFAFTVVEDDWKYNEDDTVERTIVKIGELFDVGPVTYPAYPDTTVAARSLDAFREHIEKEKKEQETKKEIDRDRQKDIERKYLKAGRIINRCGQP